MNTITGSKTAYEEWVLEHSSQLPEDYNCFALHQVIQQVEECGLLNRWLYAREIASIAHQQNVLRSSKVHLFPGALAHAFDMLEKGESLVLGEYAVQPHLPSMDKNWYRVMLYEPNASKSREQFKKW